eukprot:CAMPEP_0115476932 /NCGR_PEP_ID=MMETSP0271-20121206/55404_1 /TAXON_ID=71861 /ORGANISM="Scrippsiella trochoidea, Strain CCMP3099" /LENGTH=429 /DNA_ID=CAMNT_0002904385 /DNA_START=98 /DNA_END=1383 /DNA_ORIENTATION=-
MAHLSTHSVSGALACPVCEEKTPLAADGALRVDTTLKLVVEVWKERQAPKENENSESSPAQLPPTCGFCEEKLATRRCVQCDGFLCEECEKTSHSKGFFKSHTVVDWRADDRKLDKNSADGSNDFSSKMLCEEHTGEKLTFYCMECRRPVCSHCLILGEHKGHGQCPIDGAFDSGKETLNAWIDKHRAHIAEAGERLDQLRNSQAQVRRGAEAQRNIINSELDHLARLIEEKQRDLLKRSEAEEEEKRAQLRSHIAEAEVIQRESSGLVERSKNMLSLNSDHAFLAVLLPLIQDMKIASQPVDKRVKVSSTFRPLSTDAQMRSLGELDLGHPKPPASLQPHVNGAGVMTTNYATRVSITSDASTVQPACQVLPGYNATHTLPNLRQHSQAAAQPQHGPTGVAPSVYVYRNLHATVTASSTESVRMDAGR